MNTSLPPSPLHARGFRAEASTSFCSTSTFPTAVGSIPSVASWTVRQRCRSSSSSVRQALKRQSGARGLRSILENVMLELMYEIPSRDDVEECLINEEVIEQGAKPLLVLKQEAESA